MRTREVRAGAVRARTGGAIRRPRGDVRGGVRESSVRRARLSLIVCNFGSILPKSLPQKQLPFEPYARSVPGQKPWFANRVAPSLKLLYHAKLAL